MHQTHNQFEIHSQGKGLYDFTHDVARWLSGTGIRAGLLTLFVQHTSASLVIQENADPDVRRDLDAFLSRLAPEHESLYHHTMEGPDDMPAHIRAALTQTQLSIPVIGGALALGAWQGIYLFEHRRSGHIRRVVGHLIGE